jgi:hypothetical protein
MARNTVPPTADRERQACFAGKVHDTNNVIHILDADDYGRVAIHPTIEKGASFVILGILRSDHSIFEIFTKL